MRITIEGEAKEIAALERELKSGKTQIVNTYHFSPEETSKQTRKFASDLMLRHAMH